MEIVKSFFSSPERLWFKCIAWQSCSFQRKRWLSEWRLFLCRSPHHIWATRVIATVVVSYADHHHHQICENTRMSAVHSEGQSRGRCWEGALSDSRTIHFADNCYMYTLSTALLLQYCNTHNRSSIADRNTYNTPSFHNQATNGGILNLNLELPPAKWSQHRNV